MNPDDKNLQLAANARLVHLNEQLVYPLLDQKIKLALSEICNNFKFDSKIDPNKIAYICACRDLRDELEIVARNGDRAAAKL